MLSKNFISLIESMKSYSDDVSEDRSERMERRAERRKDRAESKFGVKSDDLGQTSADGSSDFKVRPFVKAVETLKSQVLSEIFRIDQIIDKKSEGHKIAASYRQKFDRIIQIVFKIQEKVAQLQEEGEGRKIDDSDDAALLRDLYSKASTDFTETQKEWDLAVKDEEKKYFSDLKDSDINTHLINATKAFDEAKMLLNNLLLSYDIAKTQGGGDDGKKTADLVGTVIKAGGKYSDTSTEGKAVIEVKKTIYNKFKKHLGQTADWKVVYKSWPKVSGTLLKNTQAVIKGVKAGLSKDYPELKDDKTGNITPAFVAVINKVAESNSNIPGKLITFENFIKGKMNEDFDSDAAISAMGSGSTVAKNNLSKKEINQSLIDNKPPKKKINPETPEEMEKRLKEETKREWDLEQIVKDLKKIEGVEIVSGFDSSQSYRINVNDTSKGYLAKCKGLKFFQDGVCIRTYDGQIGYYNPETGYYKGKDGWREKITDLIKNYGVPKKYAYLTNKLVLALLAPSYDGYAELYEEYWEKLNTYPESTIKAIFKSAKWLRENSSSKIDILVDIRKKADKFDFVKAFYDKHKNLLKELV